MDTQAQAGDGFAPHFVSDEAPQAPPQQQPKAQAPVNSGKPQSFEAKFEEATDRVSKELGVDTSAIDQADGKDVQFSEPERDPLGDADIEYAPGLKLKRKEISAKLRELQTLKTKQKEFERAAYGKMQAAAEQRKAAEAQLAQAREAMEIRHRLQELAGQAKSNPAVLLREFGIDPEQYSQQLIEQRYQELQKTPEQRERDRLSAYEQQVRAYEQQLQRQVQEQQEAQRKAVEQAATQKHVDRLQNGFMATADKLGLPKTALTIQRFANLLASAIAAGKDPSFEELGKHVKEQYKQDAVSYLDNLEDDKAFQELPKQTQEKIRRSMLSKLGAPSNAPVARGQSSPKPSKPMSTAEYNAYINKLRGG